MTRITSYLLKSPEGKLSVGFGSFGDSMTIDGSGLLFASNNNEVSGSNVGIEKRTLVAAAFSTAPRKKCLQFRFQINNASLGRVRFMPFGLSGYVGNSLMPSLPTTTIS